MSVVSLSSSPRTRKSGLAGLVALAAVVLAATGAAPAGAAKAKHYTRAATVHRSAHVSVSASSTVTVRVSAKAGSPAVTRSATVRATARRSGSATASAVVHRTAHAKKSSKAKAKARSRATRTAKSRATSRARSIALRRARAAAHAAATAAARSSATKKARTAAAAAAAAAKAPCGSEKPYRTGLRCSWSDEFNGSKLDTTKWSPVTTASSSFINNAAECFVDSRDNIAVSGGTLKLTTRKLKTPITCVDKLHGTNERSVTSGSVSTIGKFTQTYGQFSVRAKFPASTVAGLQSSIWMWPSSNTYGAWPLSGELDIAEWYSKNADRAIPYMHYYHPKTLGTYLASLASPSAGFYGASGSNVDTNNFCTIGNPSAFHTYTMLWQAGTITIKFDGRTCIENHYTGLDGLLAPLTGTGAPFNHPFFLNLTQALGVAGTANAFDPARTPLPATTEIDYVRVWN